MILFFLVFCSSTRLLSHVALLDEIKGIIYFSDAITFTLTGLGGLWGGELLINDNTVEPHSWWWWWLVPGEKGGERIFPGFCSGLIIQFINGEKVELGLHFKDLGFCQILKIFLRPHLSSTSVTISNCVRSRGNWSKKNCRLGDQISGSEKPPARRVC